MAARRRGGCRGARRAPAPRPPTSRSSGVEAPLAANVLAYLDLDEEPCDAPRWRVEQLYRGAPARIRDALQAFGYYEPTIEPELTFAERLLARAVHDRGRRARAHSHARSWPDGRSGARRAVHGGARASRSRDRRRARSRRLRAAQAPLGGSRRASAATPTRSSPRIASTCIPRSTRPTSRCTFDSGARYAFGRTELTQDVLTEQLASSYLTFREGEPYDARQLVDVYAALADSGYFRTIDVRPLPADPATRTIPIAVALTSAPRTHDELRHRLLDGHAAALSLRPQQPALQRPRPPVRHQRAALARHLGGARRTIACR